MHTKKLVTIAIPVYNEERNLPEVFSRLNAVLETLPHYEFEILQIDNGSSDRSGDLCISFQQKDPRWKYLRFSRNFGIEASFYSAAVFSSGDAMIYLFSDLQDPPEKIPEILQKWQEGYEVVYGVLTKRQDNNFFKSYGARLAYKFIFKLSEIEIPINATDFRLLARPVIDALVKCPERTRYMRGLTHWSGFRQTSFSFERSPRKYGESKAGFWFCVKYALSAMISFTAKPLRWASVMGISMTGLSFLGTFVYLIHLYLTKFHGWTYITPPPPGWTTLVLLILFFGGVQCLFLGILGEYLAQIQIETKRRPVFVVEHSIGVKLTDKS